MRLRITAVIVLMVLASAACGEAVPGAGTDVPLPADASMTVTDFWPFERNEPTTGTPPEVGAGPFTEGVFQPGN